MINTLNCSVNLVQLCIQCNGIGHVTVAQWYGVGDEMATYLVIRVTVSRSFHPDRLRIFFLVVVQQREDEVHWADICCGW